MTFVHVPYAHLGLHLLSPSFQVTAPPLWNYGVSTLQQILPKRLRRLASGMSSLPTSFPMQVGVHRLSLTWLIGLPVAGQVSVTRRVNTSLYLNWLEWNLLATMRHRSRIDRSIDNRCPQCRRLNETFSHVLQCPEPTAVTNRAIAWSRPVPLLQRTPLLLSSSPNWNMVCFIGMNKLLTSGPIQFLQMMLPMHTLTLFIWLTLNNLVLDGIKLIAVDSVATGIWPTPLIVQLLYINMKFNKKKAKSFI
jgi:hypothetical protein